MLIHSYFTDGFFNFGVAFVLSFKVHHGEEMPMLLTTRGLSTAQIELLYGSYKNLVIDNKPYDFGAIAKEMKLPIETIKKFKIRVENIRTDSTVNIWKLYASVKDRYRHTLSEALNHAKAIGETHVLHFDADSLVRAPLAPIFEEVEAHDVTIQWRPGAPLIMKVLGCLIGLKCAKETCNFLEKWGNVIDEMPLHKMPRAYGQSSFWIAHRRMPNGASWGRIQGRKWLSRKFRPKALIWAGNAGNKGRRALAWRDAAERNGGALHA